MEHLDKRPVAWAKEQIRSCLRTALFCLKKAVLALKDESFGFSANGECCVWLGDSGILDFKEVPR